VAVDRTIATVAASAIITGGYECGVDRRGGCVPEETVLLVEDEPAIRELIATALTLDGYQVLTARNGVEALQVFDQHGQSINLVLTDIRMPYLEGDELIAQLKERRRTLKIVAFSAYPGMAPADGTPFIAKPFTHDQLLALVRATLNG
jgi:CheY-like chemotaxis protein